MKYAQNMYMQREFFIVLFSARAESELYSRHLKSSLFFASIQIQWLTVMVAVNNFLISNEYFVRGVMFGIDTGPRFYVRVVAAHSAYQTAYVGDRWGS